MTFNAPATPKERPPHTIASGVFSLGVGSSVSIACLFLEMIIAVRWISDSAYGLYVLLIAVTNFLVMFVDFGCKTAVTQHLSRSAARNRSEIIASVLAFRILAIMVLTVIVLSAEKVLRLFDSSGTLAAYLYYIPLMTLVASLDELFMSMLQGIENFKSISAAAILRGVLRVALSALFLVGFDFGVIGLIYSFIISFALSALYQYTRLPPSKPFQFSSSVLKSIVTFAFPLHLGRFLWFLIGRVNVFCLGALAGPASVASFSVAERIPVALQRLCESFTSVYFPRMTRLLSEGSHETAELLSQRSMRILSFGLAFLAILGIVFGKPLITLLFTDGYSHSYLPFTVLMISLHMEILVQIMGYTLTSAGYPVRSLLENSVRAFSIVSLNLLLIPRFGVLGAALATLIGNYIGNPICVLLLRKVNIAVKVAPLAIQTIILYAAGTIPWFFGLGTLLSAVFALTLFMILSLSFSTIHPSDLRLIAAGAAGVLRSRLHGASK